MKVAYLVNQYPKTSHSFIRREIAAVEAAGVEVVRFTVRATTEPLVDPRDRAERSRTRALVGAGALRMLGATLRVAISRPVRFARALGLAARLSRPSDRGLPVHLVYLAEACLLSRWLAREGAAHLHAHFGTNATAVALLCRALGGPPFSFTVHSTLSSEHPVRHSLGLKVRHARFACAVSRFGLDALRACSDPGDGEKLHVVRCGLDGAFLDAPLSPLPGVPRVACIARFSPEKGHANLLEAMALLEGPAELELIGDGDLRPEIERAIERHGLAGRVRLLGWLDGDEVRARMLAAKVVVIPSSVEGLPVVAMEALALGRPVAGSRVGGLPELVDGDGAGRLVPPGDPQALAGALGELLREPPDAAALAAARSRVWELHDASKEGARLAALFLASGGD